MRKSIIILFVVGLALRIVFVFFVGNFYEPSAYEYGEIARNIVEGNGFSRSVIPGGRISLTSSHAPFYPYFLALFYQFGSTPLWFRIIEIIQAVISAMTIIVIYGVAEIIFDKRVANVSAAGIALYPYFIYYSTKLVPTTFLIFFLSLAVFLVMKSEENKLLIVAGVILGLGILCDPVVFAFIPAIIIWFLAIKKYNFRKLFIIISISILLLIPWTVRNYVVHHHFVPVTTQFGVNFWIGNNPYATGTDYFKINPELNDGRIFMLQTIPENVRDSLSNIGEIARSDYYLREGVNFIRNEPFKFLKLLIKKAYYYWWFTPSDIYTSKDIEKYGFLPRVFYLFILLAGIGGLILSKKYIKDTSLIIMMLFFVSLLYIVAHVGLIRYRVFLEPYLIIFASFCFCSLYAKIKNNV